MSRMSFTTDNNMLVVKVNEKKQNPIQFNIHHILIQLINL